MFSFTIFPIKKLNTTTTTTIYTLYGSFFFHSIQWPNVLHMAMMIMPMKPVNPMNNQEKATAKWWKFIIIKMKTNGSVHICYCLFVCFHHHHLCSTWNFFCFFFFGYLFHLLTFHFISFFNQYYLILTIFRFVFCHDCSFFGTKNKGGRDEWRRRGKFFVFSFG